MRMSVSEKRILIIMSKVFLFSLTIPHSNIHTKIFCSMGKVAFRFRPSRQKKVDFTELNLPFKICLKAWLEFHLCMYVLFAFKKKVNRQLQYCRKEWVDCGGNSGWEVFYWCFARTFLLQKLFYGRRVERFYFFTTWSWQKVVFQKLGPVT